MKMNFRVYGPTDRGWGFMRRWIGEISVDIPDDVDLSESKIIVYEFAVDAAKKQYPSQVDGVIAECDLTDKDRAFDGPQPTAGMVMDFERTLYKDHDRLVAQAEQMGITVA